MFSTKCYLYWISCLCLFGLLVSSAALAQTQNWTVNNGKLQLNGATVFPRGFYYVSHYSSEKTRRLQDMQKISAAGYSLFATPVDLSDQPMMDAAAALGLKVVMEFNATPESLLQKFRSHPALAWLNTFDDVDALSGGYPRYTPAYVDQRSAQLKSLAPNTLTYASGFHPTRVQNYVGTTDVLGLQTYPVPYEPISSVTLSYIRKAMPSFQAAGLPFISNLQTFNWYGSNRYPTPLEARNMTYQALAAGVNGILYYAYYDPTSDLNKNPALWTELTKIGTELKVLEPYLLFGTRAVLTTGEQEVFATSWKKGTNLVVAVINATPISKRVSVTLNQNLRGSRVNLFSGRPSYMSLSGKVLSGTLPANTVVVYRLPLLS